MQFNTRNIQVSGYGNPQENYAATEIGIGGLNPESEGHIPREFATLEGIQVADALIESLPGYTSLVVSARIRAYAKLNDEKVQKAQSYIDAIKILDPEESETASDYLNEVCLGGKTLASLAAGLDDCIKDFDLLLKEVAEDFVADQVAAAEESFKASAAAYEGGAIAIGSFLLSLLGDAPRV